MDGSSGRPPGPPEATNPKALREVGSAEAPWRPPPITVAPAEGQPFPVAAVVVEDDTYHALGSAPGSSPVTEHPLRVLDDAHGAVPARPGSVVVRPGVPLRLLAVVHALDRDPTWTVAWVAEAYAGVFAEVERRRLSSVALPPLGTVHGRLDRGRSLELLSAALDEVRPASLGRVWLVADPD